MTKEQTNINNNIAKVIKLVQALPSKLKINSEYKLVLVHLEDARANVNMLHIKRPKRMYGNW